jgi:hypothetical protein
MNLWYHALMTCERANIVEQITSLVDGGVLNPGSIDKKLVLILPDIERRSVGTTIIDQTAKNILFLDYLGGGSVTNIIYRQLNNDDRNVVERMALDRFWYAKSHQEFISRRDNIQLVFAEGQF